MNIGIKDVTIQEGEEVLHRLFEEAAGKNGPFFQLDRFRVVADQPQSGSQQCSATVRVRIDGRFYEATSGGRGPVLALQRALRRALGQYYPCINEVRLTSYRVSVLNSEKDTAQVKIMIDSSDGRQTWSTVGVSDDILNAGWLALADGMSYKLFKDAANSTVVAAEEFEELTEAGYGWGV